jgi:hypothetical protein
VTKDSGALKRVLKENPSHRFIQQVREDRPEKDYTVVNASSPKRDEDDGRGYPEMPEQH